MQIRNGSSMIYNVNPRSKDLANKREMTFQSSINLVTKKIISAPSHIILV